MRQNAEVIYRQADANFADAGNRGERTNKCFPTGEPDFVVFSIIAHDPDALADARPQPAQNRPRLWQDPGRLFTCAEKRNGIMSEERIDQERPCLHCMMVELIDDFFAKYPAPAGGLGKVDTTEADEVIGAIAKTVAELTSQ